MITTIGKACLVALSHSGSPRPPPPYERIRNKLCSDRGQSRDAIQAIQLEETSPSCNNMDLGIIFDMNLQKINYKC